MQLLSKAESRTERPSVDGGRVFVEPECSKLQYFRQKQEDKASKALFLRWGTPPPPLFTLFNTDLIQVIKLTRASPLFLHTARD